MFFYKTKSFTRFYHKAHRTNRKGTITTNIRNVEETVEVGALLPAPPNYISVLTISVLTN